MNIFFNIPKIEPGKKGSNQYQIKSRRILGLKRGTWLTILFILLVLFILGTPMYLAEHYNRTLHRFAANTKVYAQTPQKDFSDVRVQKLHNTLSEYNSPLTPYAEVIVALSDEYDLPYTLIASIAYKESTLGKHIKPGSYNAWGVMAWDKEGNRSIRMFSSWQEAIEFEAKLLGEHYKDNMMQGIQETYCPSFECSETWVDDVTSFAKEVNN